VLFVWPTAVFTIIDRLTLVPEPATMIAGAILLIPFALSTWPILRRRRTS